MGEWTTLSVRKDTAKRFNDVKAEADGADPNVPDMSADQFLNSLLDTLEAVNDGHYGEPNDPITIAEVEVIADQLASELDQLDNSANQDLAGELDDIRTELEGIKSELRKVV